MLRRTMMYVGVVMLTAVAVRAAEPEEMKLIPVSDEVIAARVKTLAAEAPKGAKLVAYLDCGSQQSTAKDSPMGIKLLKGEAYQFPPPEKEMPVTQPTVFFDGSRVEFLLSGIKRTGRYVVGLTWWDYDANGRAQLVAVTSPDGRSVRVPIPATGLPDYTVSGKPAEQKQFMLPATFAKDGNMKLFVQNITGGNAVISELWIWEQGEGE